MSEKIFEAIKADIEGYVQKIKKGNNDVFLQGFQAGMREAIKILKEWLVDVPLDEDY